MPSFVEPVKETGRLNLKDRFGNKAHVDYEIKHGENPAVSIARAIEKQGGKCSLEFDEKLGKHYIKEIELGDVHMDGFIQFYDKNQRMLCRVGKDGDVLWENLDSIDLTKHRVLNLQDDVGMTQELRDPLEELALRSGAMQYQRRSGGGGDHREEMSKDQIEKLERETVFSISVDPNTYEIFDESGKKITKFDDLIFKMNEQLASIGMPIMPRTAEPAFNAQLTDALRAIIPKEITYALENKNPVQMLDGFPVSIAVTLQMVAIKFDAFDRYGISVASCTALQNMQANERVEMEVKNSTAHPIATSPTIQTKTADHFYVDLPVYSRMRTEKNQNPKDEENPIIRMIMNPTERRLWGKLFGFPDEEQTAIIIDQEGRVEKPVPVVKPKIVLGENEYSTEDKNKKEAKDKKPKTEKEEQSRDNRKTKKYDPKDSKKKDERKEKDEGSDESKKPGGGKAAKRKKPEKEELTAKKEEKLREAKLNDLQKENKDKKGKKTDKAKGLTDQQEQEAIKEKRKRKRSDRTRRAEGQLGAEPALTKQKRIKQTEKKEKTKLENFPEKKKYGTKKAIANDSKKPKSIGVRLVVPENTKTRREGEKLKQKERKLAEKTELKTTKKIRGKQELIKQSRKPEQQKSKTSKKERKKSKKMSSFVLNWLLDKRKRKRKHKSA